MDSVRVRDYRLLLLSEDQRHEIDRWMQADLAALGSDFPYASLYLSEAR